MENKRVKIFGIVAILMSLVIIGYVLMSFVLGRSKHFEYKILPYSGKNFTRIIGNKIMFYNGVAFYEQEVTTNSRKTLYHPPDLPNVEQVYWSENGAVLQFSEMSLMNFSAIDWRGQKVPAQEIASSTGFARHDINRVAWYLDFSTGDLYYIDTFRDADWKSLESLASNKQFLLYGKTSLATSGEKSVVLSFTPGKQPNLTPGLNGPAITSISGAFRCVDSTLICVTGQARDGTMFIKSTPENNVNISSKPNSLIRPSTSPNYVIVGDLIESEHDSSDEEREHGHDDQYSYKILNVVSGDFMEVSLKDRIIDFSNVVIDGDTVMLFDLSPEGRTRVSYDRLDTKIELKTSLLDANVDISNPLSATNGIAILQQSSGSIVLVGEAGKMQDMKGLSVSDAPPSNLASCLKQSDAKSMSNFVITVTVGEADTQRVGEIRRCYLNLDTNPMLYSLKFDVVTLRDGPVLD